MSFIDQLKIDVAQQLQKLDELPIIKADTEFKVGVIDLLKMALKNELEASELAALWLPTTPEIEVKLGLARQCGDEAKHYRQIEKRLIELGAPLDNFSPLAAGYSPLFQWLTTLQTTAERLAAGPFAREAIAIKRNAQFIALLEAMGDGDSAALYRDQIQPDEEWHHNFGRSMLERYAVTPEQQAQARNAALRTLSLADELREAALAKTGACAIPGC